MPLPLRHSYGSQVREYLRNAIIAGNLAPGERLNEATLANELGISRTPLREAITVLAAEGWVEQTHNRGAHVAQFKPQQIAELLGVRQVLELGALDFILARDDYRAAADRLAKVADHADQALMDREFPVDSNSDFHLCLLAESKNTILSDLGQTVHAKLRAVRFRSGTDTDRRGNAMAEHRAVIDALRNGNQSAAKKALTRHLTNATAAISDPLSPHTQGAAESSYSQSGISST